MSDMLPDKPIEPYKLLNGKEPNEEHLIVLGRLCGLGVEVPEGKRFFIFPPPKRWFFHALLVKDLWPSRRGLCPVRFLPFF